MSHQLIIINTKLNDLFHLNIFIINLLILKSSSIRVVFIFKRITELQFINIWHQHLEHLFRDGIKQLTKITVRVEILNEKKKTYCNACVLTKQHVINALMISNQVIKRMKLTHADLKDSFTQYLIIMKELYYLMIINDLT